MLTRKELTFECKLKRKGKKLIYLKENEVETSKFKYFAFRLDDYSAAASTGTAFTEAPPVSTSGALPTSSKATSGLRSFPTKGCDS